MRKTPRTTCFVVAMFVLCAWTPVHAATEQTIYAIFSIDVESTTTGNPELDIWGRLPGQKKSCGIEKMMNIFDEHGVKATFFVNIYEIPKHGWDASRLVCQTIHNRKHDVELHTHPKPMFGMGWLWQSDLMAQTMILQTGKDIIESWIDDKIVAHRAGDFSADANTLIACRLTEIPMDFSWNSAWEPCKLAANRLSNAPFVQEGVLEVPTTCYSQATLGDWRSMRFLDLESSSAEEVIKVMQELKANNVRTMVITIHSFSFSRWGKKHTEIEKQLQKLITSLQADPDVKIVTARKLYDIWRADPNALMGKDCVPTTGWVMTYKRSWLRLDEGWKNIVVAFTPVCMVLVIASGTIWVRHRKRRNGGSPTSSSH